jgi:hypothetical protein
MRERRWGLARLTPLQVLHHLGDMMTLMVAAPAGIGEMPHVHAEHEPELLLRGFLRCPHVFPFVPKTVAHGFYGLACGDGCFSANARLVPGQGVRPAEAKRGVKKPARSGLALKSSRVAQR